MEFEIRLKSVQDVLDFVVLATSRSFPITVGNESYRVNGKSFMEMCCLDFRYPQTVRVTCSEEAFHRFRAEADHFVLK